MRSKNVFISSLVHSLHKSLIRSHCSISDLQCPSSNSHPSKCHHPYHIKATFKSSRKNSNCKALSLELLHNPTPAHHLEEIWGRRRTSPQLRILVPLPVLYVDVRQTISSPCLSISHINSSSFPISKMIFHIPKASPDNLFTKFGLSCQ